MGGCGGATAAAQEVGAELDLERSGAGARAAGGRCRQMLLNLGVGQVTQPFGSAERISVLVLCGRDEPAAATGPTAEALGEQILQERVNRRAQRYLRDLRRDAVIDYR